MFDWFWEFLYSITKSILRLIDGLVSCANKLCGIETITVDGTETDFMSYILRNDSITNGFRIAAILGFIVLILFTIFRIIHIVTKEKPDMTPGQVCIKSFKALLTFMFIPAIMITLVLVLNTFLRAMYTVTLNGQQSIGSFLFGTFSQDAVTNPEQYQEILGSASAYLNTDTVMTAIELSDFDFFLSWIAGGALLISLGNALLTFVDRAISIAVLFIISPFSIASSVLDDGARFKLWREQVIIKFLVGYGMIIFINIYCLLVSLITPASVVFFSSSFLNSLFKLIIIIGGGYATIKSMALVGNLISANAGSREMMDAHVAGMAGKVGGFAAWGIGKGVKKLISLKKGNKPANQGGEGNGEANNSSNNTENNNTGEPLNQNPNYKNNNNLKNELQNNNNNNNEQNNNNNPNQNLNNNQPIDNAQGNQNNNNNNNNINNNNDVNRRREQEIRNALNNDNNNNINNQPINDNE